MKIGVKFRLSAAIVAVVIFGLASCADPAGGGGGGGDKPAVIDITAIEGVTIPATGGTPVTSITGNAQYSGTVTWSPEVNKSEGFASATQYTATIRLTVKSGYTLQGVKANFFTVAGAISVSNSVNSGVVIAVFPHTGGTAENPTIIDIAAIQGVTIPATGGTPVTSITENAQYSGTVAWSPDVNESEGFAIVTQYTATITLTARTGYTLQGVAADFFTVEGAESVSNAADSGVITAVFPQTAAMVINIAAIQGVTAPVTGAIPVTTITENEQYGGTVTWSPDVIGTFAAITQYTATITLTPKTDYYTLQGVTANYFRVDGAESVSNAAHSGVITATFPRTAESIISELSIQGISIPAKDGIPVNNITENEQYSGTVTWSPNHSTFAAATEYTAIITLTAKTGYTLQGVAADFFKVDGAESVSNSVNSGVITAAFPSTSATVIDIAAIQGVTVPVTNEIPVTSIIENEQYRGTVIWSPDNSPFAPATIYTAKIYLTPKSGHTVNGVSVDFFNVAGATAVSNDANSGIITAVFPQTNAVTPVNRFEYYWVNQHGNLVTTSGGVTTVAAGTTLIITAQSTGYTVKQWYLDGVNTGQSGNTYNFSSAIAGKHTVGLFVEKDGRLYNTNIIITINNVTVTYNINGGTGTTPTAQTVSAGSSVTLNNGSGLSRTGYTFGGWNIEASGTGTNYSAGSSYTPTGNITLYARWTSTVTFNVNGGTGTVPSQTAPVGSSIMLPSATRPGYIFGGWSTNTSGTGDNYNANSFYTPTGNITLYARWNFTITFNVNSGTGTIPTQTAPAGSSITLPSGSGLSRSGYTFGGWNTLANGTGTNYNAGDSYTVPTSAATLYARWIQNITVTFSINNGIGTAPDSQSAAPGTVITLPDDSGFTRSGYIFDGWYTGSSYYDAGSSYTTPTSNVTLYAYWRQAITITFNINGGTGTAPPSQIAASNSLMLLPDGSGFTRPGYIFGGWNTNSNGSGTPYKEGYGLYVVPSSNTTLYAMWIIELTENTWVDGTLGGAQWFTFTASATTQYIHTSFGTLNSSNGINVQVYNSSYSTVGSQTRLYSYTEYTSRSLSNGQVYYIRVTPYNSSSIGTYQIAFNTSTTVPPVTLPPGATTLTLNTWANGTIPTSSDVQWFKFSATASLQYIHVSFNTLSSLYVQLYDNVGNKVGSAAIISNTNKYTSSTLSSGQMYYIKVWPYGSSDSGTYKIAFNTLPIPPDTTITTLTLNTWANGTIPTSSDVQWFKFSATAPTQYIHIDFGTLTDLYLQLYDSNGNVVEGQTNFYGSTKSSSRTLTSGQMYYIKVWPYSTNSGTYQIAFNTSTTVPPITLPNDATTLTLNTWTNGTITSGNAQWFKFSATASTQYIHVSLGTLTNLYVQLYDNAGNTVESEANITSSSTNKYTSRTLASGQMYYIKVWPYSSTGSGTYQIAFNTLFLSPSVTITQLTDGNWVNGTLTSSGEQWFMFEPYSNAIGNYIHISFGTLTNLNIQIYDNTGNTVGIAANISSSSSLKYCSPYLYNTQTHYIKVWPYSSSYSGTYKIAYHYTYTPPPQ